MLELKNFVPEITVIGGCGHVGLPLSVMFASRGKKVCALDINKELINKVNNGIIPFIDEDLDKHLLKALNNNCFLATDDPICIKESNIIIIIIGTPVDEHLNPKVYELKNVINKYLSYFKSGQLIVLRSTVYPGTTELIYEMFKGNNLDVDVSFCPERIAQGFSVKELVELPQIISSFSENGIKRAKELFNILTNDIVVLKPIEAELAKLFTNTWRYINFAISNQFYMIANDYGVDFYKIYHAMTHNYPRTKNFPRAGFAAGPCLFKDTMQLASFYKNNFFLGHAAMLINEGLPNYIVDKIKSKHNLKESSVGILGLTFKADNDDIRESLSFKLKKLLELEAKKVYCSDYYLKEKNLKNFDNLVSEEELINNSDIIIIATPHKKYKNLDYKNKKVYDIWNFLEKGGII